MASQVEKGQRQLSILEKETSLPGGLCYHISWPGYQKDW